jgi:hypothetical protein
MRTSVAHLRKSPPTALHAEGIRWDGAADPWAAARLANTRAETQMAQATVEVHAILAAV